jgi:hypothetical protein
VEGLCCLLVVIGGVWLLFAWHDSGKKKRQEQQPPPAVVPAPVVAAPVVATAAVELPDWPLREAVLDAEHWLGVVGESARAAYQVGAPVPVGEVQGYLDQGWGITGAIGRKMHAIAASHGPQLKRLPRKTRGYLDRDEQNLNRLSARLRELREDLTNVIAAGGVEQPRKFRELDDDIRALGRALQHFTD